MHACIDKIFSRQKSGSIIFRPGEPPTDTSPSHRQQGLQLGPFDKEINETAAPKQVSPIQAPATPPPSQKPPLLTAAHNPASPHCLATPSPTSHHHTPPPPRTYPSSPSVPPATYDTDNPTPAGTGSCPGNPRRNHADCTRPL